MPSSLPITETVVAQYGSDCVKTFYVRDFPDPNQNGSPGTLKDLTGAAFVGDLTDYLERRFTLDNGTTFNLGSYLSVGGTGKVTLSVAASLLAQLPPGSHRYWVGMTLNGSTTPLRRGQFAVSGPRYRSSYVSPSTVVSPLPPATGAESRYAGSIPSPIEWTYVLDPYADPARTISVVQSLKVLSGSLTATLLANGSPVTGATNLAVTTTAQTVAFPTVAIGEGQTLAWQLTNLSGGVSGFQFSITATLS